MKAFPFRRIIVVGATSSGKSTLAEALAHRIGAEFIELDALHWEPGWREAPPNVFRQRVQEAVAAPAWVIAGNYRAVRDITWPLAEAILWLDYPLWTIFRRLLWRTLRRWWMQELLWGTNRENLWVHLKLWSDDSLFHWLFKTYWRRKREIPALLALPEYAHLSFFRFENPQEAQAWLDGLLMG
jgi:adenylate kinase family enzyme